MQKDNDNIIFILGIILLIALLYAMLVKLWPNDTYKH